MTLNYWKRPWKQRPYCNTFQCLSGPLAVNVNVTYKIKWKPVETKSGLESALDGFYLSNFDNNSGSILLFDLVICPSAKKHSPHSRVEPYLSFKRWPISKKYFFYIQIYHWFQKIRVKNGTPVLIWEKRIFCQIWVHFSWSFDNCTITSIGRHFSQK